MLDTLVMAGVDEKAAQKRREELQRFITARDLKVKPWAKKAKVSNGSVRNFLMGRSKTLTQATVDALAAAADATATDIFPSLSKMAQPQRDDVLRKNSELMVAGKNPPGIPLSRENVLSDQKDLPILGHAKGGSDAYFIDNGEIAGYTMRPKLLDGVKGAYAIEVWDRSMEPALKHGRYAAVHPFAQIEPGDEVVIQLHDGQALVKELVRRLAKEWLFRQHNPPEEIRIAKDKVKAVHLIVASNRVRTL